MRYLCGIFISLRYLFMLSLSKIIVYILYNKNRRESFFCFFCYLNKYALSLRSFTKILI